MTDDDRTDDPASSDDESGRTGQWHRTNRRRFLGSVAAAIGTGIATGPTAATTAENLTWNFQTEIYDLFPSDPACDTNVLTHRVERFQDSSGITEVNNYGSDLETTYDGDSVTIENTSESVGEDWLLPWSDIPQDVPSYALYATIDEFTGGEAIVGVYDTVDEHVEVRLSRVDGNVQVFEYRGGSIVAETELQASVPAGPVDVLVTFMGDALAVNYRVDGGLWEYAGWTELGTSFYDQDYISNFAPGVGALFDGTDSITFGELRVLSTQQFGYRDPFLVTHKDGAPMIEDDRYIYMTWSAGAPALQYGAQNVHKFDLETYETELVGRIQYNTENGRVFPDYPTKLVYDDDTDEFITLVSGWVTYTGGSDSYCHTYVTRTTANVLEGLHVLSVDDTNLPGTGTAHVYDIDLHHDSNLGLWRGCANETNHAMNTVETADDSLTGGWSVLDHLDSSSVGGGVVEGGRVRRVDGTFETFWANQNAPETMSVSDFPDFTTDVDDVTTDADRWSATLPSHPQVVEIPDTVTNETSYLLFTFGNRTYEDMGRLYSEGELLVFEAAETNAGLEYPTHTFPSGYGASSSSGCDGGTAGPIPDGTYWLENVNSGKAMDVADSSTADGGNVQQYDYWGGTNQQWNVVDNGDGTYRFENVNSGKVLSVADGSTGEGASLVQWTWNGNDEQRWTVVENGDGSYRLENADSGYVADVNAASTSNGADIIQWGWNGGDNQQWRFNTSALS